MRLLHQAEKICLVLALVGLAGCMGEDRAVQSPTQEQEGSSPEDPFFGPAIDGSIEIEEWNRAKVFSFDNGAELYLLISGKHLYLAIQAEAGEMIAGNVFLENDGQVSVLHTSAALGTALYQKQGEGYQMDRDFEWCCRSRVENEASRKAREEFYGEEGWLGINSFLGSQNELEYKILLQDYSGALAVNFIYADGEGEKQVWPVGLDDGVAQPTTGGFPEILEFSIDDWITVEEIQ